MIGLWLMGLLRRRKAAMTVALLTSLPGWTLVVGLHAFVFRVLPGPPLPAGLGAPIAVGGLTWTVVTATSAVRRGRTTGRLLRRRGLGPGRIVVLAALEPLVVLVGALIVATVVTASASRAAAVLVPHAGIGAHAGGSMLLGWTGTPAGAGTSLVAAAAVVTGAVVVWASAPPGVRGRFVGRVDRCPHRHTSHGAQVSWSMRTGVRRAAVLACAATAVVLSLLTATAVALLTVRHLQELGGLLLVVLVALSAVNAHVATQGSAGGGYAVQPDTHGEARRMRDRRAPVDVVVVVGAGALVAAVALSTTDALAAFLLSLP